jgi:hypothetical protein
MNSPRPIALHLDLAEENPVSLRQISAELAAADTVVYKMTEFGAEPTETGTCERRWTDWARAFDRMLATATDTDEPLHIHIFGRAAQPIAAYAGLRLAGSPHALTVHNHRRGTTHFDAISAEKVTIPQEPFFPVDRSHSDGDPTGVLALFIGMGQGFDPNMARRFLQAQNVACAGIHELNTHDDSIQLGADNAPAALWHIRRTVTELQQRHVQSRGLALFLACPFTMAFALGRAINPNALGAVWLPIFRRAQGEYRPALYYPRHAPRHGRTRIMLMSASPKNESIVDVQMHQRQLRDALTPVEGRFELDIAPDFRNRDFLERVSSFRPDIVHILCHGASDGTIAATSEDAAMRARYVALVELLDSFRELDLPPRVVVFNACYSSVTADKLRAHADTTIGAREPLHQDTAAAFAREFYGALARGHNVRRAFTQARDQLGKDDYRGAETLDIYHAAEGDRGGWTPFPR